MKLHIYTRPHQPATRFRVDLGPTHRGMWIKRPGNALQRTHCCDKRRPAKNLTVQVYYDCLYFSCRAGKGCKAQQR